MALKDLYNRYYLDYISANISEATSPDAYNRHEIMKTMSGHEAAFNHDYQLQSMKIRLANLLTEMLLSTKQQRLILGYLDNFNLYLNISGLPKHAGAISALCVSLDTGTATNVADAVARCMDYINNVDCHMYQVLHALIQSPFQHVP
jgi:hypothetical protein